MIPTDTVRISEQLHYNVASLSGIKLTLEILHATENLSVDGERELSNAIIFLGRACEDFRDTIQLLGGKTSQYSPPEKGKSITVEEMLS
jgi:hypothetical protein